MVKRWREKLRNPFHRLVRAVRRLWRRRALVYGLSLAGMCGIWLWSTIEEFDWLREALGISIPLLAAALSVRILAYLYLAHIQRSIFTEQVRATAKRILPHKAQSLSIISGAIGGLAGGILSGPLVAHVYITSTLKEWGTGVFGPGCDSGIHSCIRFYWILFCGGSSRCPRLINI